MAKNKGPDQSSPQDFPQGSPRDLYPTSDIRFVMIEVGKLSANVERLISDVKSHGAKLDHIDHQTSFIKGGLAVGATLISAAIGISTWVLTSKWEGVIQAVNAMRSAPHTSAAPSQPAVQAPTLSQPPKGPAP